MTETKHTPGPFIYTYNEDDQYHQGEILDLDGNLLAIVAGQNYGTTFGGKNRDWNPNHKEEDMQEHKANAALFSAAPELLKALQWALPLAKIAMDSHRMERIKCGHVDINGTYKNGETWVGIWQEEVDKIESAQDAITKALGELN